MSYTTYYLKFSSKEECEQKLTEVNYRKEVEYYPPIETIEVDEDGNEVYNVTYSEESIIQVYYDTDGREGAIDIIGDIWNDDGEYSEMDPQTGNVEVISPPTKKDGWHVNIILKEDLPEALQEFVVNPENPHRIFA